MKILPDFIIAGAPKCGTTALWNFLNDLPGVCMAANKEPKFFTEKKGEMETRISGDGPRTSGHFYKGFNWYSSLFRKCYENQLVGEGSTLYFFNDDAAYKIREFCPQVKLIFMLREPVDRIYSHYWQEYKLGFEFPGFSEMVSTNHPRFRFYFETSRYKKHLQRYFSVFMKEQVLIIIMEDFKQNPQVEFRRVLSFLNLPLELSDQMNLRKNYNQQTVPRNRNFAKLMIIIQQSNLGKKVPQRIRPYLGSVRTKLVRMNYKPAIVEKLDDSIRAELRKRLSDDVAYVRELLNRPSDLW